MVSPAEIQAALASLQTAFNIAKGLNNLRREGEIKAAVSDIQSALMDAQSRALEAQLKQSSLVDEVDKLKAEIDSLKAWDREKEGYVLHSPAPGVFTYLAKVQVEGSQEPMQICPHCYEDRRKSVLQKVTVNAHRTEFLLCHHCNAEFYIHGERPDGRPRVKAGWGR